MASLLPLSILPLHPLLVHGFLHALSNSYGSALVWRDKGELIYREREVKPAVKKILQILFLALFYFTTLATMFTEQKTPLPSQLKPPSQFGSLLPDPSDQIWKNDFYRL